MTVHPAAPPRLSVPLAGRWVYAVPLGFPVRLSVGGVGFGWASAEGYVEGTAHERLCPQAGVCGHRGEPPGVLLLL